MQGTELRRHWKDESAARAYSQTPQRARTASEASPTSIPTHVDAEAHIRCSVTPPTLHLHKLVAAPLPQQLPDVDPGAAPANMGLELTFFSRVASILLLPLLLYTILPLSLSSILLKLLKFLAALTIVNFGLHEAFYPPTWLYTRNHRQRTLP